MIRHTKNVDIRKHEPVLDACLDQLTELIGVSPRITLPTEDPQTVQPDFQLRLPTSPEVLLLGELKKSWHLTREEIRHFILACSEVKRSGTKAAQGIMLFTPWVPDSLSEALREAGIFYVDTLGNAFLKLDKPRMVIHVKGHRPEGRPKADPGRLFEVTGLKVLHLLLTDPGAADLPVRVMGPKAGVSAASTNLVLKELARVGYIDRKTESTRIIADTAPLLDYFIRGYAAKLRPHLFLGTFRHRLRDMNHIVSDLQVKLTSAKGLWAVTGGIAAGLLTHYLKTDHLALFVDEKSEQAIRAKDVLPDPREGNLTLFRLYSDSAIAPSTPGQAFPLATRLLVYAELLHDGRARELETAEMLRATLFPGKSDHAS